MLIERNYAKFVIFIDDTVSSALAKLSDNKAGIVFVISGPGLVEGAISDGDIRRWLLKSSTIDLDEPVSVVMNTKCVSAKFTSTNHHVESLLSKRIQTVPLIDDLGCIVALAFKDQHQYKIEDRIIAQDAPTYVIAEVGNNHNGSLALAKKLIDEAKASGADCVKFQMRDMGTLYSNCGNSNDVSADLGAQYTIDLLSQFQLPDEQLISAFDYCKAIGIQPLCTPWDVSSLKKLEAYGMPAYKVASADFTNYELLDAVAATGKVMICSTGMANEIEVNNSIRRLQKNNANFILLHCNSTYPAPFKDINLSYMTRLKQLGGGLVGYSGHERDIHVPIAAVAIGARVIEKHFTLDRSMEGNDHKVSLMPAEFSQMVTGIRQVEAALGEVKDREVSQGELMNREVLAKSLVASRNIAPGERITEAMMLVKSPGQGIQPNKKADLVGMLCKREINQGEPFTKFDLGEHQPVARDYRFTRPWGIPVRYHDFANLAAQSNMDLVEMHLSYKDLEVDFESYLPESSDMDIIIHAPELFKGDHTLDLCSLDERYRQKSVMLMQGVIDLTRKLSGRFITKRPCIVTNVGGFSENQHYPEAQRLALYAQLEISLSELDMTGVEVIPQTMPPFPWHFGGQQFHNLFVRSEEIVDFCKRHQMRVCLDVSHSKLATNFLNQSFGDFLRQVAPYTAHMHLADADGFDGEGLQVGEGGIDWLEFSQIMDELNPTAHFIPEIWQGHKSQGAGAWLALERLEALLGEVA